MPAEDRICLRDNCMLMRNGNKRIRVKNNVTGTKAYGACAGNKCLFLWFVGISSQW